jgi:protein phosphatase-4 regulatory subunit 3
LQHVLHLTERKEKYVVVSAIRFLRACVSLKDEFYNRYFIKMNAFDPVMKVFKLNGDKYNLLNSSVLELIDFIRRENIRNLIHHLVEKYEEWFEEVYYVDTFRLLKLRYQQGLSAPAIELPSGVTLTGVVPMAHGRQEIAAAQALSEQRARRDGSMSKDEEDYFESDDDPASDSGMEQPPHLATVHSPPVLHFQGSRFAPAPMAHSVFEDEVDTGPTHGELGKRGRSASPPPSSDDVSLAESEEDLKKPKPGIASPHQGESLTAAQRNAFKPQVAQPDEEKHKKKEVDEKEDVKQTANPTSSWVTVDETSEEKS